MKLLIFGMQSSGASLVALFLTQKAYTLGIVDLHSEYEAPSLVDTHCRDIVLKAVITALFPLQRHVNKFKPDKTVFVLRHPYHNYASLKSKAYAEEAGEIDEKFKLLEKVFRNRDNFDAVILYEDFVFHRKVVLREMAKLGFGVNAAFFEFGRSREEILEFNLASSSWCRQFYKWRWGFGNIDFHRIIMPLKAFKWVSIQEKKKIRRLCPSLCGYYNDNLNWNLFMRVLAVLSVGKGVVAGFLRRFVN